MTTVPDPGPRAEAARARHGESLALYREAGDRLGIAHALLGLGLAAVERGDAADAERLLRECLAIQREIGGDRPWLPVTLHGLAGGAALRRRRRGCARRRAGDDGRGGDRLRARRP